jgi:TolB protein
MLRSLGAALTLLITLPGVAHAVTFEVPVQGSKELTLAIPEPQVPGGAVGGAEQTVWETLRRDLELTGYFELINPAAHIERGKGVEPGSFEFGDWRSIRAATLAKTRVLPASDPSCDPEGRRMCVDVYVYDVVGGGKLAGRRLRATPEEARALGHAAATVVLRTLVGEDGFFGAHLAAVGTHQGAKEIYVLGVDGAAPQAVTRNGSINLSPAWSPNGGSIAWTSYKHGNPDLYVKDLRTGDVRTVSKRAGVNISGSFSPDGNLIALARSEGGDTDIWLIDAASGRDVRRLTTGGGIDVSPSFTPDGRYVVFSSERSGGSSIYKVPVEGGTPTRVTPFEGFFTDPIVSPDGERVAFVSRAGHFDILSVRLDGSGMLRITQDAGDNEDPSWSPDSKYLVFTSTRDGSRKIWMSTANGRHQVALTSSGGWSQPVWQP